VTGGTLGFVEVDRRGIAVRDESADGWKLSAPQLRLQRLPESLWALSQRQAGQFLVAMLAEGFAHRENADESN